MRTAEARKSLKMHQINLLQKLNASLQSFKETQTQCYAPLPRPVPHKEHSTFASCHGLLDVLKESETQNLQVNQLPQITLLRCAWEDFRALPGCADSNPRTEELFQVLESRIPWLVSDEGLAFEVRYAVPTSIVLFLSRYSAHIVGRSIDNPRIQRIDISRLPRGSVSACTLGLCPSRTRCSDSFHFFS